MNRTKDERPAARDAFSRSAKLAHCGQRGNKARRRLDKWRDKPRTL